jgi:N-acyl homoserine lactone hydrolase
MKETVMQRTLISWALGVCAGAFVSAPALAQATPEVTLTRLDCGTSAPPVDVGRFSDTFAHPGLKIQSVFSCYLVRHGDTYLLWDTGHAMTAGAVAPKVSVVDQLAQLQLKAEQVQYVGISHYHADHTGQLGSFPQATLLIGKADWDLVASPKPPAGVNAAPFAPWTSGGGKVDPVPLDKDVFGDGTVVMLATPGHTPGHHSLLVKLRDTGNVLITGDLSHFHENYDTNGVPNFNTSRADTLASLDRFKQLATNLKATVIIQHDRRDVARLPAFPAAAR